MSEDRYAHLTSGLLARKGDAEPALEPFAHARVAESARRMTPGSVHKLERNPDDQRHSAGRPQHCNGPSNETAAPEGAPGKTAPAMSRQEFLKRRAAVTFRMSTRDFLRLKLASAEIGASCQNIILAALEAYLDANGVERLDDCKCLRDAARLAEEAQAAAKR